MDVRTALAFEAGKPLEVMQVSLAGPRAGEVLVELKATGIDAGTRRHAVVAFGTEADVGREAMKSPVVKRSIVIAGHKTSVSLEDAFWKALKEIAGGRHMTLSDLVAVIDSKRQHGNLSSAIRLFVLDFYRNPRSEETNPRDEARESMANA
jgi:predicted DNA-binding ribbon-helix-helix protein